MTDLISVLETPTLIEAPAPAAAEKPKKTRKPRAPLSPEKKEKLLANLAKARTKAAENRKAKKAAKETVKPEPVIPHEVSHIIQQKSEPVKIDPRDAELAQLRERVKTMTLQDVVKKPRKKRVKKSAAIQDTDDEADTEQTTTTHHTPEKIHRSKSPEATQSTPVQKKQHTAKVRPEQLPATPINVTKKTKKLFGKKRR